MSGLVSERREGEIGVIALNNPPVNALGPALLSAISQAIEKLRGDDSVRGVVLIGGDRTFSGGADINEFGKMTSGKASRDLPFPGLLEALEQFPKPVVCAIHGFAFGGGLELAMACHYRVAVQSAQVGQPEVKLGIIPGAGGTQRLPRLAGVAVAAELCAIGNPISTTEAEKCGIIDRVVSGDLLAEAVRFTREVLAKGEPPRRTRDLTDKLKDRAANEAGLAAVRAKVVARSPQLLAAKKAIDAVEAATTLPFAEGLKKEAELFQECLFSDQSKALIHVFFGEREVAKVPGVPKGTPTVAIKKAAVVGAGTMGGGIAMVYANAGIPVLLKETSQEALDLGLEKIKKNYAATVKKGRLTAQQMDERLARIEPTLSYDRFTEADIIVEAVFEGMELKKQVFAELDRVARPDAVLASNTSTLDVDAIASATSRPQQVIGHHYFSPANVMRLLEIVRGRESSPAVLATSMALSKKLAKVGVVVGNCQGFVANRTFGWYMKEAQFLVEEGAKVEQVDAALVEFGMAMGPMAVGDLAGLDVGWRIRKEYRHLEKPGQRQPLVADLLCENGHYGQKTGSGWYKYPPGTRNPVPYPEVESLIAKCAKEAGIKRRAISAEEIVERTVYAVVVEAARALEEGFASRAVDIDIIYVNGFGFPAYRGGPMWHADTIGLAKVVERISQFEQQHGSFWKAPELLKQLASAGRTFAAWDREKAALA